MQSYMLSLAVVSVFTVSGICSGLLLNSQKRTVDVSKLEEVSNLDLPNVGQQESIQAQGEELELYVRPRGKAKKQKEKEHGKSGRAGHTRDMGEDDESESDNSEEAGKRLHAREKNRRSKNNERNTGRHAEAVQVHEGKSKKKTKGRHGKSKHKHHKQKHKSKSKRPKIRGSQEEREPDPVPDGPWVRLVDGSHDHEGRVEVYVDGYWGSLCDDGLDMTDAGVICRQLGFTQGASEIVEDGRFAGFGHLDIVMDDIECEGEEVRIQDCQYITDHNCGRLTEVAQLICAIDTVTEHCPEQQMPGLLMSSSSNLVLGLSGQVHHPDIAELKNLLDGTSPLVSTEDSVQVNLWMQDDTELSFFEMTVVNAKKIWVFINYRDNTHSQKLILPRGSHMSERPWQVEEVLRRKSGGVTVSGLQLVVINGGGSFSLANLQLYGCMESDQYANCPANSGLPIQLREGTANLAVAVNGNQRNREVPEILSLLGGAYTLQVTSATLEIAVWLIDKQPLSHFSLVVKNVDSLRITYHFMNGQNWEKIITRPNKKRTWSIEESFKPSGAGHPTFKITVFFTARRNVREFEIEEFQVYSCSPPDGKMPTTTCYEGDGENYRGMASTTEKSTPCMNWLLATDVNPTTHPSKGLGNHNFCRNPDSDVRPWCWVNPGVFGYCDIPICGEDSGTHTLAPTPPPTCNSNQFTCGSLDCVPQVYVCDGEADCLDASDEDGCANVLDMFETFPNEKLDTQNVDEDNFHEVKYMFTSLKECAKRCLEEMSFICRGFNYEAEEENCILYSVNAGMVGLTASSQLQFYQLLSQAVQCTADTHFQCLNGRCILKHLQCNDIDNCHDFSDEAGCATPPPLEVRLVGGNGEHEGQVQVKYMNEWGSICDDHWDIKDANVVCTQLGYKGAIEATVMSQFGFNTNILLDNVECHGNESRLEDCSHGNWRDHDCRFFETAGVVCRVGKVCSADQFECGQAAAMTCIPIDFVCDGERDCSDGSDEGSCDSIEVLLVDGSSEFEGRVEIVLNGVRGTVCDDAFDDLDAKVVCRMLGFDGAAMAVDGGTYGEGTGPIWVDDLNCSGSETDLTECVHRGWSSHNCMHSEDAGVRCFTDEMTTPQTTPSTTTPGDVTSPPVVCGQRYMNQALGRIIGGFEALYGAYPWQAGIRKMKNFGIFGHWCGGTILNNQWILSAAHCFEGKPKNEFRVRTGDWDNEVLDDFEQEFEVEEIFEHNQFSDTTYDYDIALLKIKPANGKLIEFNEKVQPACLPAADTVYRNGTRCIASGWGSTGWDLLGTGVYPDHLQAAITPLIHDVQCKRLYKSSVSDRMVCAGYIEGNIDSCQGDSGGPLVCRINGANTVLGVTSWGNGCAEAYAPGVYARVVEFLPWIHQYMQK